MKLAPALLLLTSLACAGCATRPPVPALVLAGDAAHPATAAGWVRTELYFGLGTADGKGGVDEAGWRAFLDQEVTPRFPSGLTVVDAYGQWQGKGQSAPERLRSKVVVLLHPDTPAQRMAIDAIRAAWKARTGDQSVLRVSQPAEVSF
ncbi:DUF3574 domain-containing protein [Luteibacter sp. SG786]|uniref:DUF3574 domain-containing protein n=1 Tax=Luteibacter sp. SG786 TaxID=2587130 RepID=UPI0014206581|nr:DUF3574 domain-containing protein [Luteibacter sp. SG786]NII53035.1 hypothetical protein [Luteibacter sp. SG786]